MNKSGKYGFTLLEVVVSLGILALGILGIFSLIPTGVDQNTKSREQAKAVILAQSKIEELMAMAASNWNNFNKWEHNFYNGGTAPYYVGPNLPSEQENWGWIRSDDGSGTAQWIPDVGYQWEWHFIPDPADPSQPCIGNIALISLTVSWPQKWSLVSDSTGEENLILEYYDDSTKMPDESYFLNNNIQYVRLISYVSKGL